MSKPSSPYYPPRARWYAPLFYTFNAVRRGVAMDRLCLPTSVTWLGLCGSLLVPGLGFYLRGPRLWSRIAMAACGLLFLIFIVWIGYPAANLAFGLIVSIHTSGIVYYCGTFLGEWEFKGRILFTLMVLMAIGFLIYSPLRNVIQNHWLMPVQINGHVIVVEKSVPASGIHRGDLVAYLLAGYRFSNHYGNGVADDTSLGLGPVLGVAGDRVEFSTNSFSVNGVSQPLLPHMPHSGALVVPQNDWFIWPNLTLSGNWDVGENNISSAMLQLANVSESQFVGKPLKHWFWRKQILP